ncbi:hypothetical protein A3715_10325 [Oleiphilus sp. HI0009]|nr:hypothetical protein A3715_10325 [Oleiphilus sp. HI0009]
MEKKLNKDMSVQLSDSNSILFGIKFSLPESVNSTKLTVDYIQDNYFNDLNSSGFFRLLPESKKELASFDYLNPDSDIEINDIDFTESVNVKNGKAVVEILLGHLHSTYSFEEEISHTSNELNVMVSNGFASDWEQFDLRAQA